MSRSDAALSHAALSHAALSRAELLTILVRLPRDEWSAAARAAGYQAEQRREPAPTVEVPASVSSGKPLPAKQEPPAAYQPSDLPDQPFWRIAAITERRPEERADQAPDWLQSTPAWTELPESDPAIAAPEQAELTTLPRQARFLRRQLVHASGSNELDVERLCERLAERRLPPRLPRRQQTVWPARVNLLIDLSQPLRPYHADFWRWVRQLRAILGRRLRLFATRDGHPGSATPIGFGARHGLVTGDGALIVLSDAGLYRPLRPQHEHWCALGERWAGQGVRPLLLAPYPARLVAGEIARHYDTVPLERDAPLQALNNALTTSTTDPTDSTNLADPTPLLAAIAHIARVEPATLRALRLALHERGADIGWEYALWNHPEVIADELACALLPSARAAAQREFANLPHAMRARLQALAKDFNRHQSPLLHMEDRLSAANADADEMAAQAYAATLYREGDAGVQASLAGYIAGLARRRADLIARSPGLAAAWGLAHRDALRAGQAPALPPGLRIEALDWLTDPNRPRRELCLRQAGDRLGMVPGDAHSQGASLARLSSAADYWQIEPDQAAPRTPLRTARVGDALSIEGEGRFRLDVGQHRFALERITRPAWAEAIGQDGDGLFVELGDGRRLNWMPQMDMYIANMAVQGGRRYRMDGTMRHDGSMRYVPPHGFWWDQAERQIWLDHARRLPRPEWASDHGVDAQGWWAEFGVAGVTQRLRWIAPGEFWMGSPEREPGRQKGGEYDETRHRVVLTQGYWLAETTCTQALWAAVLGEHPSHFDGEDLPVEQVSWADVSERFLPVLNAAVPGLEVGLPSEAQWEYACRAGTDTPFWFGESIDPQQVNYDGNFPYPGGKKGEYRERTVAVKALLANGWGLYQMHGNVWEWCADGLGTYPEGEAIDPRGPAGGRERVLRGGGWFNHATYCRSAVRRGYLPGSRYRNIGFRLARGFSPQQDRQAGKSEGAADAAAGRGAPAAAAGAPEREGWRKRLRRNLK